MKVIVWEGGQKVIRDAVDGEVEAPDMAAIRTRAVARVVAVIDAAADAIAGPVPEYERASWPTKEAAARAYLSLPLAAGATAAQAAMIEGEATVAGETPAAVAARIVANADAWIGAIAALTGRRRVALAAIAAAETPDDVQAALTALSEAI